MASTCPIDLPCGETLAVLSIPHSNLLAVVSSDLTVRIYKHDTDGNEFLKFEKHPRPVVGLVHLDDDIVASIGLDGNLFTWNATNGKVLENAKLHRVGFTRAGLVRLSSTAIAVKRKSQIQIVKHTLGRDLIVEKSPYEKNDAIRCICAHNGKRFAVAGMDSVRVENNTGNEQLRLIKYPDKVERVAVNDKFLAVACEKGWVFLRRNGGDYPIISSRHLRTYIPKFKLASGGILAISFVSSSVLMINLLNQGIFFLSVPDIYFLGRIDTEITGSSKYYTAIMGDTRICIGSKSFCRILDLPPRVQSHMQRFHRRGGLAPVTDKRIEGGETRRRIPNDVETAPANNDIIPSLPKKRNREEPDSVGMVDSTGENSKKTARLESERDQSAAEELKDLVATQGALIESINKERKGVKKGVQNVKLELEEFKREREILKNAADVRDVEMEKIHRQMEEEKEKILELKKRVLQNEEVIQARPPTNRAERAEIARMQTQLDDLRTVLGKVLFESAARGGNKTSEDAARGRK